MGGRAHRESDFGGQQGLIEGITQDWEKQKLHPWRMCTRTRAHQDPGEKSSDPHKRLGQTYLLVLESLAWRWVGGSGSLQGQRHWQQWCWGVHTGVSPPGSCH